MTATSWRHLAGFFTGGTTDGLHAGLRVALALGLLVGGASGVGHDALAAAAAQSACTATPCPIAYGSDPFQFGELRVPSGPGPHPMAVLIHGGCWLNLFDLTLMDEASEALTAAGLASVTFFDRLVRNAATVRASSSVRPNDGIRAPVPCGFTIFSTSAAASYEAATCVSAGAGGAAGSSAR